MEIVQFQPIESLIYPSSVMNYADMKKYKTISLYIYQQKSIRSLEQVIAYYTVATVGESLRFRLYLQKNTMYDNIIVILLGKHSNANRCGIVYLKDLRLCPFLIK